jgi:hypothetical protein
MQETLRNLLDSLQRDPGPLLEGERVVRRLELDEASPP